MDSQTQAQTQASAAQPLSQHQQVAANISQLSQLLLAKHPQMPMMLRTIHAQLKEDPAVVTLLSEEEISVVIKGLESQTNTFLAASMTKTSASKTKALKNVTTSDLGFD